MYTIKPNGRKIINSNINKNENSTQLTVTYDDGTILDIVVDENDSATVSCNKSLQINSDGTIDMV
ncbi:hypothetical protein [Clostridium perfringens]|uniref:hypothetical protein n=1 Tax=Clostridium perfringens TaxID=1502 RepID=UPI0024BC8849|nr:hypothetical protein [Clostridium perfringens]